MTDVVEMVQSTHNMSATWYSSMQSPDKRKGQRRDKGRDSGRDSGRETGGVLYG